MRTSKGRSLQRLTVLLLAAILSLALAPAALADTGDSTPKITQQPDQLVLQLGTRWAGVEFELRTDAGVFPVPSWWMKPVCCGWIWEAALPTRSAVLSPLSPYPIR